MPRESPKGPPRGERAAPSQGQVARRGRRTRLTPQLQEHLCVLLREGNYLSVACAQVGIGERTAYEWLERGTGRSARGTQAVFVQFAQALEKAQAESEASLVRGLRKDGEGGTVLRERTFLDLKTGQEVTELEYAKPQWLPKAWLLERRFPERWTKQERRKHEMEMSDSLKALLAMWESVGEHLQLPLPMAEERPPWQGEEAGDDEDEEE